MIAFVLILSSLTAQAALIIRIRTQKDLDKAPTLTKLVTQSGFVVDQKVIQKKTQKYDVISSVPFEDYIAGVVSKEMSTGWPIEALKAQAVIARSYALARMLERYGQIYDLDSSEQDQVFDFTNSQKVYKSVRETQNNILTEMSGKVLKAFYHSDCGGYTIPANQVWEGAYDSGTAVDPWCRLRQRNQWSVEVSKDFFDLKNKDLSAFQHFREKITKLFGVSVQKIRARFGYNVVRNSPEKLRILENSIEISGRGYGHGVGLCQWGAREMAKQGHSYEEILMHYYPKAILINGKILLANSKNKLSNNLVSQL